MNTKLLREEPTAKRNSSIAPYGAIPTERQMRWHALEAYALVHFSLSTFADMEWGSGEESSSLFNPSAFDAEQWARVSKEAGLKGIILVCKHHDGFCLWPTQATEYCVRNSPWKNGKGDVVAETSAACRKYGLKFGVYLSPWDRNHPEYGRPGYVEVYHRQLREVLTGYGPLFEIWFDGANGGEGYYGGARERRSIDPTTYYQWDVVEAMARELQPEACLFSIKDIRYVGNECGVADETSWATQSFIGHPFAQKCRFPMETGDRHGKWMPAECDFPLRKGWFFHEKEPTRQPTTLFEIYFSSVGRGGSMNIGLAPDKRGIVHEDDVKSLRGWKALMDEIFTEDLLKTKRVKVSASNVRGGDAHFSASNVIDGKEDTYWASDDDCSTPQLIFEFDKPVKVNVVSVKEHIALGQRVDAFVVDIWNEGRWGQVGGATSIGHRRLLILKNAETCKLRLQFVKSSACPVIREVALFRAPMNLILGGKLAIVRNREGYVDIRSTNSGLTLRYTIDGTEPDETSPVFTRPFKFSERGTVKAFGAIEHEPEAKTAIVSATFGMDRSGWSVLSTSLDSPFANGGVAGVAKLLDDDPGTYWHTYHVDKTKSAPPHEVVLDMGRLINIAAFTFQPRLAQGIPEAIPDEYEFHLSQDGANWTLAAHGEFANIKASPHIQLVHLAKPLAARYLRFVALHVIDDGNYVAVAGIGAIEAKALLNL